MVLIRTFLIKVVLSASILAMLPEHSQSKAICSKLIQDTNQIENFRGEIEYLEPRKPHLYKLIISNLSDDRFSHAVEIFDIPHLFVFARSNCKEEGCFSTLYYASESSYWWERFGEPEDKNVTILRDSQTAEKTFEKRRSDHISKHKYVSTTNSASIFAGKLELRFSEEILYMRKDPWRREGGHGGNFTIDIFGLSDRKLDVTYYRTSTNHDVDARCRE